MVPPRIRFAFAMKGLLTIFVFFFSIASIPGIASSSENVHKLDDEVIVIVSPEKNEFLLGEPITLKIHAENCGPNSIDIGELITEYFDFSAKDKEGQAIKSHKPPAQISLHSLINTTLAGADYNDVVFVNKLVNFQKPGTYDVFYKGCLYTWKNFLEKPQERKIFQFSGNLKLKIRKSSDSQLDKVLRIYLEMIKSDNDRIVKRASQALTVSDADQAVKLLKESLNGNDEMLPSYSSHLTWALAKIGTEKAIKTLIDTSKNSNNDKVRIAAIEELGRWHIKDAVPTLVELLYNEKPVFRSKALEAIGDIRDKSCIPNVEKMLNDPDVNVKNTAIKVHKLLTTD